MGNALLDGQSFRIDPMSVSWDYSIKASEIKTVGGRVIQVFGSSLGDMQVQGSFGVGGWQEQLKFLNRMKQLGDRQQTGTSQPVHFTYPSKGWDFLVYLKAYTQPGAGGSVSHNNAIPAPEWQLTLFIVEDNAGLHLIAQDTFIARLAQGIGWKGQSEFNGPVGYQELQSTLTNAGASDVQDYLSKVYGVDQSTSTGVTGQ